MARNLPEGDRWRSAPACDVPPAAAMCDSEPAAAPHRHTLWMLPTEGSPVSFHDEQASHAHVPGPDEPSVPELEVDETIPPRPEEEIADVLRAKPDVQDHTRDAE